MPNNRAGRSMSQVTSFSVTIDGEPHQPNSSRQTIPANPMQSNPSVAVISTSSASGVAVSSNHVEIELPPESIRPSFVSSYEVSI